MRTEPPTRALHRIYGGESTEMRIAKQRVVFIHASFREDVLTKLGKATSLGKCRKSR